MSSVITRFAPSPTGYLHIGNARTAIINWLFSKKQGGKFILRLDDTDVERSKTEYQTALLKDLKWLGLEWDETFKQSDRLAIYNEVKDELLRQGRLYPCFETPYELELKRKTQLARGLPPIYDRASLKLSKAQIDNYIKEGRKPHYRFLIEDKNIIWQDIVKGEVKYQASSLSDPIVIRENGSFTYMLCSVKDDVDYKISHIIRGEDHVTNTAVQIQMFEALGAPAPQFGHLNLVKAKEEKISKRIGGFEIEYLRDKLAIEAKTILSFFAFIGSSKPIMPINNIEKLIQEFDISAFSKSPTLYMFEELAHLNHKFLINLNYQEARERLQEIGMLDKVSEKFWDIAHGNLKTINEIKDWYKCCFNPKKAEEDISPTFITQAVETLPDEDFSTETWGKWTTNLQKITGIQGKELFLPLRLALTGMSYGLELKKILPLIGREEVLKRLNQYI